MTNYEKNYKEDYHYIACCYKDLKNIVENWDTMEAKPMPSPSALPSAGKAAPSSSAVVIRGNRAPRSCAAASPAAPCAS